MADVFGTRRALASPRGFSNLRTTNRLLARALLASVLVLVAGVCETRAEFQVNTYTLGNQADPSIASNAAGDVVVVWSSWKFPFSQSQDGDGSGVFGQRYDSSGARVGAEFQINITTTGWQNQQSVAMDPAGNFVVAWESDDANRRGVFARRYDSTPLSGELQLNTYTAGEQIQPHIAMDAAGNFVVVWTSITSATEGQDGSGSGVFGQRFDSDGTPVGTEFQVNTFTTGHQGMNGLAVASAPDGSFVVVWKNDRKDGPIVIDDDADVCGQRFDSAGLPVGTEFQVNTYDGRHGEFGLSVATEPTGGFIVVWTGVTPDTAGHDDPFEVLARRYDAAAEPRGTEFVVNTFTEHSQVVPSVTVDAAGGFVILWQSQFQDGPSDSGPDGVFGQRFDNSGARLGTEFQVNTVTQGNQFGPAVATDAGGNIFAVWESSCFNCPSGPDGSDDAVEGQRFVVTPPSCPALPKTGCGQAQGSSLILRNSNGNKRLKWKWVEDEPTGSPRDLGNPAGGLTSYVLCTYVDTGGGSQLRSLALVPAGGTCKGGQPCWKAMSHNLHFVYRDDNAAATGITNMLLKARQAGHASLRARGKGGNLDVPELPITGYVAATVQLINGNGECWEAAYGAARSRNDRRSFKATF